MKLDEFFDHRVPLAIVAALLLQAGTAIWWAATTAAEQNFQQQRLESLETTVERGAENQMRLLDRLARIEERVSAEAEALDRIEKQLGTRRSQ